MPEQAPHIDQYGAERHPSFALISASRVSHGGGGATLFQSDIRHQHTVVITISSAARTRNVDHDHVSDRERLIEVEMSESQWASFVSSMNTIGVPTTLRRTELDPDVPTAPFAPRLHESFRYVSEAAHKAYDDIGAAFEQYKAKPTKDNLRSLQAVIENAAPNVGYAARSLAGHAEAVVDRARADIEAVVASKAAALGIDAAALTAPLEIEP